MAIYNLIPKVHAVKSIVQFHSENIRSQLPVMQKFNQLATINSKITGQLPENLNKFYSSTSIMENKEP